jgi:xanthine/uracil permease
MNLLIVAVTLVTGLGTLAAAVVQIITLLTHRQNDSGFTAGDIKTLREMAHDAEREQDDE